MTTKVALDQWARDAVALALYECFLATAARRDEEAKAVRVEADWVRLSEAEWLEWKAKRRAVEDPKRSDFTK